MTLLRFGFGWLLARPNGEDPLNVRRADFKNPRDELVRREGVGAHWVAATAGALLGGLL